ncbi:hypothetical protein HJG60_010317 [Phyllostomus discolor]|uniref:Uncharacterized protein n=1 Tax=Phyllostomus discolor TaxID=89673 RepID=A0A834EGG3_9CHIR|nr:hypothetical protein HJG60_010317 [Phyllostomus discolor]
MEGERERERNINMLLLGVMACNPGMYPDWESNLQQFGSKPTLNPLSYASQGHIPFLIVLKNQEWWLSGCGKRNTPNVSLQGQWQLWLHCCWALRGYTTHPDCRDVNVGKKCSSDVHSFLNLANSVMFINQLTI